MDPLAHTLVGATLAETGLARRTTRARATLIIGANLPDLDVISLLAGPDASLEWRRGWTHGVLAMVVLPPILALTMVVYDRWRGRSGTSPPEPARGPELLLLATIGVLSHPMLDWLNTYGVRLLMPFDATWFYGDSLFIVDPWLWLMAAGVPFLVHSASARARALWGVLAFAASVVILASPRVPALARFTWIAGMASLAGIRWQSGPAGSRPGAALGAIGLIGIYLASMVAGSRVAADAARRWARERGLAPVEIMAGPLPANPFVRDIVVATPDAYHFGVADLLARGAIRPTGTPIPRRSPPDASDTVIRASLASGSARGFKIWMRFPSYEVRPSGSGHRVVIRDARYSRLPGALIGTRVVDVGPPSDKEEQR